LGESWSLGKIYSFWAKVLAFRQKL
jgi:hypothetical protein